MKLVRFLFIVLLVIFPFGQLAKVDLASNVSILLLDIFVFLVVVTGIRVHAIKNYLAKPILFFVIACLLSLVVNIVNFSLVQIGTAALYLVRWISYAGLFFVLSDFKEVEKNKIRLGLLISAVAMIAVGFLQYFLYPDLRNLFYAGWDEHLFRMFGTLLDPNFFGGILVLSLLLQLHFLFQLRKDAPWEAKVLFGASSIFTIVAILLTYSRGTYVSFGGGLLLFLFLKKKKKIALSLVAFFVVGILLLPKNLKSEGVNLFRTASIGARLTSASQAIEIFQKNPIFGVGFNTYRFALEKYAFLKPTKAQYDRGASGTDNSFLFVLATTGIVGFAAYIYLWWRIIRYFWNSPLVIASIVALFIHACFVNSLFYPQILVWLWMLLGVTRADKKS